MNSPSTLPAALADTFGKNAEHPALSVDGKILTYAALWSLAGRLADFFAAELPPGPVGILATRSLEAYAGILASVIAGRAYVPLNPKFPATRLAETLQVAGCAGVVADRSGFPVMGPLAEHVQTCAPAEKLAGAFDGCDFWLSKNHGGGGANESFAYILFTSGSTGSPKGIGVTRENLLAYLHHAVPAFAPAPGQRATQMFELTFDLSVHDMFVTWFGGGQLCVPPASALMAPARFIIEQGITHWFSVPATAAIMGKLGLLRPGSFPSLRQSLFCGEALTEGIARGWHMAAPHSSLWNLYGPTEATIAITSHLWQPDAGRDDSDVVAIGTPFPGQTLCLMDGEHEAPPSATGELCLGGSQITPGYLNAPDKMASAFVRLPHAPESISYRTGDLGRRDEAGVFHYLGRIDSQIQLRGHRVELGEVETALRKACGNARVAAIGWPHRAARAEEIIAFIESSGQDAAAIKRACLQWLPEYMLPSRVVFVNEMPLNSNGKTDRLRLAQMV